MRLLTVTFAGSVLALLTIGVASAQTAKGQKKCAVSYEDCVAKSMKDGWSQPQASNYCANQRPCVRQ
jgi:hypothetical protein